MSRTLLALFALTLPSTALAQSTSYPEQGLSTDPFDITQGTTVLANNFQYQPELVLQTTGSYYEWEAPAFAYDQYQGFQSYIEFQTAAPVDLAGFVLLAAKDGGSMRRSMDYFALYADSDNDGVWELVYDSTVNPDYGASAYAAPWDSTNGMQAEVTLDTPVTSEFWKLVVEQGNNETYYSGVRVIELDAVPVDTSTDGNGTCDTTDVVDSDGDTVADDCDAFPDDPTESADSDGDGYGDNSDPFPDDPTEWADTDGDGYGDNSDICPLDALNDADGDGVCAEDDQCLGDDATGDSDGDDVCDDIDICQGNDATGDSDQDGADGYCDDIDNCPVDFNDDQADADGDGIGDVCEADTDEDGTIDDDDNCPADYNPGQDDTDSDGQGDVCDDDDDGDGVVDGSDNCPVIANADQVDYDGDGQGDACDGDDDADVVADSDDLCPETPLGALVNTDGCSGEQYIELECPGDAAWDNHGSYVSCVAHARNLARSEGLITGKQGGIIVKKAAKSNNGK